MNLKCQKVLDAEGVCPRHPEQRLHKSGTREHQKGRQGILKIEMVEEKEY